jgi:hypothetical protein
MKRDKYVFFAAFFTQAGLETDFRTTSFLHDCAGLFGVAGFSGVLGFQLGFQVGVWAAVPADTNAVSLSGILHVCAFFGLL